MRKSHLHDLLHAGPGFVCSTGFVGAAPGVAIDNTAPLCLYNPAGSSTRLYLVQASYSYVSGTPGTGSHWLCYNDTVGQAAPTGTAMIIKPLRMMATDVPVGQVFLNATLPNAANVYIPLGPQDATGAGFNLNVYYVDGFQQVDPGGILSWQFIGTAGAAPVNNYGFIWVEVTI